MSAPVRLAGFLAVLSLAFAGAALAGAAIDPAPRADGGGDAMGGHDDAAAEAHGAAAGTHGADSVRGLAVADDGLRLVVPRTDLPRGRRTTLRFAITDARAVVRDLDVTHEKRMHLIVVRRDLRGFQHLHPVQAPDGTWSVELTLPAAGSYRMLADFARDGEAHTLGADLRVDGPARLAPLPAATDRVRTDGYDVRLGGAGDDLRFAISRDGAPVRTQPYLGAAGHLVALREGDLAFLHVHPDGDDVAFATAFPSAGRYRLFLQFRHAGRVHTAAFTREVSR
jgi:hypothetical protein